MTHKSRTGSRGVGQRVQEEDVLVYALLILRAAQDRSVSTVVSEKSRI